MYEETLKVGTDFFLDNFFVWRCLSAICLHFFFFFDVFIVNLKHTINPNTLFATSAPGGELVGVASVVSELLLAHLFFL